MIVMKIKTKTNLLHILKQTGKNIKNFIKTKKINVIYTAC